MSERNFRNLLVTGGCGFIASNFIRLLFENFCFAGRIINLDKITYAGNLENLKGIAETYGDRYVFRQVDICNQEALTKVFTEYSVDAVCHFAAESHVDRSIYRPGDFIQTNIVGTYNLLEEARALGDKMRLFHHVSTDEVFGSLGNTGLFTEATPYSPSSPYSASKASSDHLVRAYAETYKLRVTISNCSNNYGPYQLPEKLVPLMILNALEAKPLPVYGDGGNVRDWLYVQDHCAAIWCIMQAGPFGRTFNVGGRNEVRNLDVVETICDLVDERVGVRKEGSRRDLIAFVKDRPGHDWRYAIDCSRIERELGWLPEETFETGLRRTVQWYIDQEEWVEHARKGAHKQWVEEHYET